MIYWRGIVLLALLTMLGGVFTLGIIGVMSSAGIPDNAVRAVVPLIVSMAIPIVLLPFIVRMALYKEYKGFELKVSRADGGTSEDLGYGESARISWLVAWRVFLGVGVFTILVSRLLLTQPADPYLDDSGMHSASQFAGYLPLGLHALVIFVLLPLGVHAMLRKRFRGFTIVVSRTAELSLSEITKQATDS